MSAFAVDRRPVSGRGQKGAANIDHIYLDNGASSFPKAPGVGEAVSRYLTSNGANVNRGVYAQATAAALTVLQTREALKELFHFPGDLRQVVLTPGATFGLNQIIRGFLRPGDHVIVSSLEHNSVMRPLTELRPAGVEFDRIPADRDGMTRAEDLLPLIRKNTKLVLVSHASNVCGAIFPLEETAELCRQRGLLLAVDAAQTAGHLPIDFERLGLAALCVPGHKGLLGPQGIGALLLEKSFAQALTPLVSGGTGSASDSERQPDYLPDKLESGTLNLPGVYGLQAALAFVRERGVAAIRQHETRLTAQLIAALKGLPLRIVGPADAGKQAAVISLDFHGMDNAEAAFRLEREFGLSTRCGLHCAPSAHKTLATFPGGTVRFSLGYATTAAEIETAAAAVRRLAVS